MLGIVKSRIFQKTILFIMNLMSRFVRKNPKIVLCGAMSGRWYGDNSRYVYEWILEKRKDLQPVWLTNNSEVLKYLRSRNMPVVSMSSLKAMSLLLQARVGIFTNSLQDVARTPLMVPDSIKLIALRHGRSVKRIRFARKLHKISEKEKMERMREKELIKFAISTSDFISDLQEECLKIGRNKHVVTGYPRNDLLNVPETKEVSCWRAFIGEFAEKRIVLYAPSWRHGRSSTVFFPFHDFSLKAIVKFLEKNNCVLLLRPHANDLKNYPELVQFLSELDEASAYVKLATHEIFPDANSLLPFADVLVTDYSAIYHDFLLLDRPMLFIPYDYSEFNEQNGFLYDYQKMLPGPVVNSQGEFKKHLSLIMEGTDLWCDKRQDLCNLVHSFQDDKARMRVVELVDQVRYE